MDNKIINEVTMVSLDKMIYYAIYERRYKLLKRPDEKIIFSFGKEFLDGNGITESTFWERLRTLEIEGEILGINHRRRRIFSFCLKVIRVAVLILVIYPTISSLVAPLHALKI